MYTTTRVHRDKLYDKIDRLILLTTEKDISVFHFDQEFNPTDPNRRNREFSCGACCGRPAPAVGPSAAAVPVAVVTANAAPSELAAVTPEAHEGVTRATVEMLAGTMRRLVPPLFRPVPGSLWVATGIPWHRLALAVSAFAVAGAAAATPAAATPGLSWASRPGCLLWGNGFQ